MAEAVDVSLNSRADLLGWDLTAHRAIYRATNNPHLEDTLVRYHNLATGIHCMFVEELSTVHRYIEEHVELLHAIVAGKPTGLPTSPSSTWSVSSVPFVR